MCTNSRRPAFCWKWTQRSVLLLLLLFERESFFVRWDALSFANSCRAPLIRTSPPLIWSSRCKSVEHPNCKTFSTGPSSYVKDFPYTALDSRTLHEFTAAVNRWLRPRCIKLGGDLNSIVCVADRNSVLTNSYLFSYIVHFISAVTP